MCPTVRPARPARAADVLVWLGGGSRLDIEENAERSAYQTAGCVVALNALLTATVVAQVSAQAGASVLPRIVLAVVAGILIGVLGRGIATATVSPDTSRARRAAGEAARALVALVLGLVLGEIAAVVVFVGAVDAELLVQRNAAAAAVAQGPEPLDLAQLGRDRSTLDAQVASATARRDQALVVARCEYRPTPGCPATRITGDPGRGAETSQAQAELAAAAQNLNTVTARRDQLDEAIARARGERTEDQSVARALAGANTGLDARWSAMNSYTLRAGAALPLRLGLDALAALLLLLPLLLRWWRGQTEHDHELLSRTLRRRAERDAQTAVAVNRARQRVALELEASVEPQPLASTPTPTATALPRPAAALTAGPTVTEPDTEEPDQARPAKELELSGSDRDRAPAQRTPIDLLPGPLPSAVRTISGLVRPLVPGPVARLAATAPRSVRFARGLWEEVEEFQITFRQQRTVRSLRDDYTEHPDEPAHEPIERPAELDRAARSRAWADAEVITDPPRRSRHRPVDSRSTRAELPPAEVDETGQLT